MLKQYSKFDVDTTSILDDETMLIAQRWYNVQRRLSNVATYFQRWNNVEKMLCIYWVFYHVPSTSFRHHFTFINNVILSSQYNVRTTSKYRRHIHDVATTLFFCQTTSQRKSNVFTTSCQCLVLAGILNPEQHLH